MKNTKDVYAIKAKKITKKVAIGSGIAVFNLLLVLNHNKDMRLKSTTINERNVGNQEELGDNVIGNRYAKAVVDSLNEIDKAEFDDNFLKIYSADYVSINEKIIKNSSLAIRAMEDGNIFLTEAGNNKFDIITNTNFTGNLKRACRFRDSSVFFQMYQDGKLQMNNDVVMINKDLITSYILNWDCETHEKVPMLKAQNEAFQKLGLGRRR